MSGTGPSVPTCIVNQEPCWFNRLLASLLSFWSLFSGLTFLQAHTTVNWFVLGEGGWSRLNAKREEGRWWWRRVSVLNNDCTSKNVCEGSETAGCFGVGERMGGGYVLRLKLKSPWYIRHRNAYKTSVYAVIWLCIHNSICKNKLYTLFQ